MYKELNLLLFLDWTLYSNFKDYFQIYHLTLFKAYFQTKQSFILSNQSTYVTRLKIQIVLCDFRYKSGQKFTAVVSVVTNHLGKFWFSVCPLSHKKENETEECFDKYPVKLANGSDYFELLPDVQGDVPIELALPQGLACKHCVFRWHWKAENNWGDCDDGSEAIGCGPQEHWRNCSDIKINEEGEETEGSEDSEDSSGDNSGNNGVESSSENSSNNGDNENSSILCQKFPSLCMTLSVQTKKVW